MATVQAANELKQQGAIEASRDPNSNVSAEDAERKIVEDSRQAGVTAFTFDPDASPEEKRAQARAAIPEGFHHRPKGVAIVTDIDDGTKAADIDLPSPSKAGAIEVAKGEDGKPLVNGQAEDEEDDWSRTGWAPQFGWPTELADEGEDLLDHSTWVESQLAEKFFGDWYHNAAVIAFACLASWLVAVLGGGLAWVFIVMAICSTYYRTSLRRVRRNFRDDITRELALKKLDTDNESVEWINSFLVKFWPIYQPVLAQTVINSVDQVLSGATPAFLDSLKLKTFTLGSKPPRMEHVKTYPKAEDDVVIMDWMFSFTPNDTADMTSRQLKNKINPKVILEIRVGKAMVSKGLDVIVENMAFTGLMRLKIKLQIPFPHVEKVEMSFLERPTIDYVCKPLGGETFGFDINFIPGLESFIMEQIHGTLAPMMYAPNVFPIEVAKMLAGSPVDQAIGVIAITLHGAQGLKNTDKFSGTPDPYAVVSLNKRQPLAQTKVVKENANPRWNETHYVIITSFNDSLDVDVYDYNDIRKDKKLGTTSFALDNVEEVYEHENERLELKHDGKARGVVLADIRFFPVLEPRKLEDGSVEPPPESNQGILRFTVEQAKELDGSKSMVGLLNPYAMLLLNGKEVHTSKKLKRTNNPIWDNGSKEILITDKRNAKLGVAIKDDRDLAGDQLIGTYQIKLDDMLEFMGKGQEWYNLAAAKTGRVKMMAQWRPVAIAGIATGTGGYKTPIGVLRLHFKYARQLRNVEALGKSDPYARVVSAGVERGRTVTFKNNLDPDWDEIIYVPLQSPKGRLQLEVMDAESVGKDRSLGLTEIDKADYMVQGENGEWLVHDEKVERNDGLRMHGKGTVKGMLTYTVAFYPTLNIADPEEEEEKEKEKAKEQEKEKEAAIENDKASLGRPSLDTKSSVRQSLDVKPSDGKEAGRPLTPTSPSSSSFPRKSRDDKEPPKVYLTPQELLKHESGVVIFRLMEADLPKSQSRIEVFVDDMAFPSYVSSTARSRHNKFDEMGDCFIRELEFSKLTIVISERTDKNDDDHKQHTLARLSGNTLDTLKQCLNNPTVLKMKDNDGEVYSIRVSLKYVPVKMQLDPSESINNMGNLRVDVLDAQDLPAADSNGKSDPYAKFELNGQEVFKTKTQKKTLNPTWSEFFNVPVPSRTAAKFKATVWDWDFADKPDFLGGADINLAQLEPFRAQEVKYPLDGKSGVIRVRMLFTPDYVTRTRQGTSTLAGTFSVPGRIVTGVAGAPIKGGVAVAGAVGHGVGKGASFLFRGLRGKKDGDSSDDSDRNSVDIPQITTDGPPAEAGKPAVVVANGDAAAASSQLLHHNRTKSAGASSVHSAMVPGAASGTASFTVVSAAGYPPSADVYVTVTQLRDDGKTKQVGKTKHRKSADGTVKFDETFRIQCTPDAQFRVEAKEHHTFGSDDPLGETLYFVDDSGSGAEKALPVGSGTVVIKSAFAPSAAAVAAAEDSGSGSGRLAVVPDSPKSTKSVAGGIRKSLLSKRG
ncbi:C2 domain-containing protein [Parachaetomium inaequale]|uniref:C2 domain-containing protein n=1 Tax=Parachaetomium inaequale TaxID=2588326 RepID=A0AAN6PKG4_9PEZI|nr:C2 domain-containing protein [Parachaetomium inaequale]